MSAKQRIQAPWLVGWDQPLPEIPSLVHFNEAQAAPGFTLPPHRHPSFELCYIVAGKAHWQNTDGAYRLGPGDLYFTLPGEEHGGVADELEPHHNFAIGFDLRMAGSRLGDPGRAASEAHSVDALLPRRRAIPGGQSTERIWMAIRSELERMPPAGDGARLLAIAMVQALLVELAVSVTRLGIACVSGTQPVVPAADLAVVCHRLRSSLSSPPSLAEMATWVGLSPGHFAVVFKRAFNATPHEYLTSLRIEVASERLLSAPHESITSIALDLGFCSSQYFSEVFRTQRGMTPSQWRQQRR